MLRHFGYEGCRGTSTPMSTDFASHALLEAERATPEEMSQYPYLAALRSIMYLMVLTRPDLAYVISALSQYSSKYMRYHWDALVRVFQYLQETKDLVLQYDGEDSNDGVYGYSDSDWAGDRETRRSTTGHCFLMSGAAISWKSCQQPTVAVSSTEAEYMALGDATKEALWIRSLTYKLGMDD